MERNMDESRKAFEQWAESNGHDTYRSIAGGGYYFQSTQWSWDIWQASRAAIEVKLPEFYDYTDQDTTRAAAEKSAYNSGLYDSQEAIRAAGIKVKE